MWWESGRTHFGSRMRRVRCPTRSPRPDAEQAWTRVSRGLCNPRQVARESAMDQKPSEPVELERMVALLRAFVAGRASRAEVAAFTRAIWPDTSKQGGPFPGNGCAATVFDSIWN